MWMLKFAKYGISAEAEARRIVGSRGTVNVGTSGCGGISNGIVNNIADEAVAFTIKQQLEAEGFTVTKQLQAKAA